MAQVSDDAFPAWVGQRLGGIPGVRAVTLGGSRAEGTHRPDSDWDFSVYYRGAFEPGHLRRLSWPGEVFPVGGWGGARRTLDYARGAHAGRGHVSDTAGAIASALARAAHAVLAARGEWITNDKRLTDRAGLRPGDAALAGLTADPECLAHAVDLAETLIAQAVAPLGL